jgi:alkanesulfonate monooxygenase SsuD/methylene tetrahydromethanopterin reductase-like flavin-dependent oxidoreductase (luciferase family)
VVLKRHCQAVKRDYDTIVQVVHVGVLVAENEREVQRLRESPDMRPLENGVIGTPEQVVTTLRAIVGQGAGRLTVHIADAPRPDGTLLFGAKVIPQLGA